MGVGIIFLWVMENNMNATSKIQLLVRQAKRTISFKTSSAVQYPGWKFKWIAALSTSQFVILFEEKHTAGEIISNPFYYLASAISIGIAFLIISLVYWITRILDYQCPWGRSFRMRLPRQLVFGVLLPLPVATSLATLYFALMHKNILETVYFTRYLPILLLLFIILNSVLFYYWVLASRDKKKPREQSKPKFEVTLPALDYTQVASFHINSKRYYTRHFNREKEQRWYISLTDTIALVDADQFFMVNRSLIINRSVIEDVTILSAKKTELLLGKPIDQKLTVSESENAAFWLWWDRTGAKLS
ncbi:MAG: hypothetical protein EOO42_04505 [Flavobacteriales bacterium]|nr:MAG: hypothetical protein EOO42_04505 [Flavobacteriales bacterium]